MPLTSSNQNQNLSSMSSSSSSLPILLVAATVASCTTGLGLLFLYKQQQQQRQNQEKQNDESLSWTAHEQMIMNGTPLIRLHHVSKLVKRNIHVKMESMNPGGTGKDRAALSMIQNAEDKGLLPKPNEVYDLLLQQDLSGQAEQQEQQQQQQQSKKATITKAIMISMIHQAMKVSRTGGLVVEGTSGSTGIALATLCAARGHACLVVLPDDQAKEKQDILRAIGAVVYEVPTAAISNPNHYVNIARKVAILARDEYNISAVFMDQFENLANFHIHYHQTGPEIYHQLNGKIDAFCMSSGTGGTIAGVGTYLKEQTRKRRNDSNNDDDNDDDDDEDSTDADDDDNNNDNEIQIVLVDPPGSALFHKIEHGVAYAPQQQERTIRKHRYDTIAEGIGLDRVTQNFSSGLDSIDKAIRVTDQEAVDMAHWILQVEGLWVGSSSAMNLVGAIRTARSLPPNSTIVTMICDGGQRHTTRFWNPKFIKEWGLEWPKSDDNDDSNNNRTIGCRIPECLQGLL